MTPYFEAIGGVLLSDFAAAGCALALWPFFARLFPRPVAWGTARLMAAPLLAYGALLPSIFLRRTPFTPTVLLGIAALGGIVAWLLVPRSAAPRKRASRDEGRLPSREDVLGFEIFHVAFLLGFALFLPHIASLSGLGERMRDSAFWNAVLVQRTFPFEDPWLSGTSVQYYVFGYLAQAVTALLTGMSSLSSYNVALATTGTAYASALFLLLRALGLRAGAASLGALLVALGSNLKCAMQALATLLGGHDYNWWEPSRVIKDTINEFPIWTMTLGDLHPHYLMLPFFPLVLLAVVVFVLPEPGKPDRKRELSFVGVSGLLLAWFQGGNTWEVPISLAAIGGGLLIGLRERGWQRTLMLGTASGAAAAIFALPFVIHGSHAGRSFGWVKVHSEASELVQTWGLFFLPLVAAAVAKWIRTPRRDWFLSLGLILVVAMAIHSGLGVLVALAGLLGLACFWDREGETALAWRLGLFGIAILMLCELIHLQDVYGEQLARLNTVFKFYMPAWAVLGIAAVLGFRELCRHLPDRIGRGSAVVWMGLLAAHLTVGLWSRTGGYSHAEPLDGLAEIARESHDDAALARWLQREVKEGRLAGTLLESPGNAYSTHLRLASASGLRGFVGWEGYGYWPIYKVEELATERFKLAKDVFESAGDCEGLRGKLGAAGVDFVAIGGKERQKYAGASLDRVRGCLTIVHAEGAAEVFRVGSGERRAPAKSE